MQFYYLNKKTKHFKVLYKKFEQKNRKSYSLKNKYRARDETKVIPAPSGAVHPPFCQTFHPHLHPPCLPPASRNARSVPAPGVLLAKPCAGGVGGGRLTALLPELARVLRRCAAARTMHDAQERSTFADTYAFDECATTTLACLDPTILHNKPDDRDDEYPEASYQRPRKFSYMRQV